VISCWLEWFERNEKCRDPAVGKGGLRRVLSPAFCEFGNSRHGRVPARRCCGGGNRKGFIPADEAWFLNAGVCYGYAGQTEERISRSLGVWGEKSKRRLWNVQEVKVC